MANLYKEFEQMNSRVQQHLQAISDEMEGFKVRLTTKRLADQYLGPQKPKKMKEEVIPKLSFASIVKTPFDENERRFTLLGTLPASTSMAIRSMRPIIKKDESLFTKADWIKSVNYLKTTKFTDFVDIYPHERTITENCPKAITFPGAPPHRVYELFCLGLIQCIYPSRNLCELEQFPKNLQTTVRRFVEKTKVEEIYLQIKSTIPEWNDKEMVFPFHVIKIGSSSGPPVLTESELQEGETDTLSYQLSSIIDIKSEMERIVKLKDFKINYDSTRILIYSLFKKKAQDLDVQTMGRWYKRISGIEDKFSDDLKNTYLSLTDAYGPEDTNEQEGSSQMDYDQNILADKEKFHKVEERKK